MAERIVVVAFSYEDDAPEGTHVRPPMRRALSGTIEELAGKHNRLNEVLDEQGLPWNSLSDLDKEVTHQVIEGRNV